MVIRERCKSILDILPGNRRIYPGYPSGEQVNLSWISFRGTGESILDILPGNRRIYPGYPSGDKANLFWISFRGQGESILDILPGTRRIYPVGQNVEQEPLVVGSSHLTRKDGGHQPISLISFFLTKFPPLTVPHLLKGVLEYSLTYSRRTPASYTRPKSQVFSLSLENTIPSIIIFQPQSQKYNSSL